MRIQFLDKCNVLRYTRRWGGAAITIAIAAAGVAQPAKQTATATAESEQLYQLGKHLFDQLAPEVKAQFEFPTKEQWDAFAGRLQHALESDSLEELAEYGPEARAALVAL